SFIGVVSTTSSSLFSSVFIVSKYISTGKNEQYLSITLLTVYSSKNSLLSSAKNNVIVVPLVFLESDCFNSNSNPSSLTHLTGVAFSLYDSVSICTFLDTIKEE